MKKIRLIGGISWYSTLVYYRLINEMAAEVTGPGHKSARMNPWFQY